MSCAGEKGKPGVPPFHEQKDWSLYRRLYLGGSTIAVAGIGTEPCRAQPSAGGVGRLATWLRTAPSGPSCINILVISVVSSLTNETTPYLSTWSMCGESE